MVGNEDKVDVNVLQKHFWQQSRVLVETIMISNQILLN